jgi:hypothetical protein
MDAHSQHKDSEEEGWSKEEEPRKSVDWGAERRELHEYAH